YRVPRGGIGVGRSSAFFLERSATTVPARPAGGPLCPYSELGTQHDPKRSSRTHKTTRPCEPGLHSPSGRTATTADSGADERVADKAQASGETEVSSDLAYPLPIAVITALLGADEEMAKQLRRWTDDLGSLLGAPEPTQEMFDTANRSVLERDEYILSLAAQRR